MIDPRSSRRGGRRGRALAACRRPRAASALLLPLLLALGPPGASGAMTIETGGQLYAWSIIDTFISTPPASLPPGTDVITVPPDPADDSYGVNPTRADGDPRSNASAGSEGGLFRDLDSDPIELFADCFADAETDEPISDPAGGGAGGGSARPGEPDRAR